MIKIGVLVDYG